jgi:gas vesicle protein
MKKVIKLTESDLVRLVKKVIKEQGNDRMMNIAAGAGSGAAYGATGGSIVPVVGTAIGGAVGGAVGALVTAASGIINGTGSSDQKVKQFVDLCKTSKVQITSNSNKIADKLRDAVQGIGTDEDAIYSVFKNNTNPFTAIRTMNEFCSVVKAYESSYGASLYDDLDGDIDEESEWVLIFRPLRDIVLRDKEVSSQGGGSDQRVSQPTSPTSRKPVR